MNKYIVKRIIRGAITFWTAITVTFLIVRLTPSNPVTIMLDSNATTESIAKLTQDFGLDKPLYVQYIKYIGNLFQGNLGVSFSTRRPVMDLLIERLPWTLLLMITVLINCFLLGIPMGVAAACKKGKTIDHVINIFAVFGTSIFIPSFGITNVIHIWRQISGFADWWFSYAGDRRNRICFRCLQTYDFACGNTDVC